jgi:hypothetical protein
MITVSRTAQPYKRGGELRLHSRAQSAARTKKVASRMVCPPGVVVGLRKDGPSRSSFEPLHTNLQPFGHPREFGGADVHLLTALHHLPGCLVDATDLARDLRGSL